MSILKSNPINKTIYGEKSISTHEYVIVVQDNYTTNGESFVIIRGVPFCKLNLDSKTTERVVIKAMTDVLIVADKPIDEEYDEIELQEGSSVELISVSKWWYIISSDGLKSS